MNNFNIIEQTKKIINVLNKGINGFVVVSVDVTIAGDWDTHPILVTVHSYENHNIKNVISITAFSGQEDELSDEQRWDAPEIKGIEMGVPEGPDRIQKAYKKLKKHFENEGFGVYNHWKDFY